MEIKLSQNPPKGDIDFRRFAEDDRSERRRDAEPSINPLGEVF